MAKSSKSNGIGNIIDSINSLWVEKYRPKELSELAADPAVISFLDSCIKEQDIPNILLHGKPGCGKNSIVSILTNNIKCQTLTINASEERGIDTIREKVMHFAMTVGWNDILKIVIMNEADGLNGIAQDSLRELIETSSKKCRFIFTCNYISRIIDPIRSRCSEFELNPSPKAIAKRLCEILISENVEFTVEYVSLIIKKYGVDFRKIINESQKLSRIHHKLDVDVISGTDNTAYNEYFDKVLSEKSLKKIADITKKTIFSDDIYTVFKDYVISKYGNTAGDSVIIIGEWSWKARNMADKDLAFMCCLLMVKQVLGIDR